MTGQPRMTELLTLASVAPTTAAFITHSSRVLSNTFALSPVLLLRYM